MHAILIGFGLGAVSVPHCAAMCGPLATLACARSGRLSAPVRYQLGRTAGYALAGALAGHFGSALQVVAPGTSGWLVFSALAALACLALAYRLLRPRRSAEFIALRSTPKRRSVFAVVAPLLPREPAAFGAATALLPCGALAAALLSAAATADATLGAATLLGFVTSSGAFLLATSLLQRLLPAGRSQLVQQLTAAALVVTAVALVARPIVALAKPAQVHGAKAVHCH
jgi:uncharacterized protein